MCATDDIGNRTRRGVSPADISSPPPSAGPAERRIAGAMGLGLALLGALSMLAALGWAPGIDLASRAGRIVGAAAGAGMIAGGAGLWRLRGRVRTRRLVGMTAYVVFLLLMAEGVLQLASRLHPRWGFILSELPAAVADPVLGHRPSPLHPEHDSNGFRNRTVPESVDFVALGDSQTYGDNADRESAWPQQLSALTGRAIYNMAFGGYSAP
ncbi:MAG: hypothetical protein L6Q83_04325, partial [Gammaproteobacteria bacterium]|nr:hypothetical protein [Gammaproteobacteria bacterium]